MTENNNKTNNRTPRSADTRAEKVARKPGAHHLLWKLHLHLMVIPTGGSELRM